MEAKKCSGKPYVFSSYMGAVHRDESACLRDFAKEQKKERPVGFDWYGSRSGSFFMKNQPQVMAVMVCEDPIKQMMRTKAKRVNRKLPKEFLGLPNKVVLICKPMKGYHDYYIKFLGNVISFIKLGMLRTGSKVYWSG
jgi:hypothetical protein